MATHLAVGFDTAEIGTFSVAISGAVGSGTATIPAGRYCFATCAASIDGSAALYTAFATAVAAALQAAVNTGVWQCTYTAPTSQTPTTGIFRITHSASAFTLTWSGTGGLNLRRALGFSGTVSSSALAVNSDVRPYYLIVPQIGGRSKLTNVHEDPEIVSEATADDDTAYGVAKERSLNPTDTVPIRRVNWQHAMETLAAVFARSASAAVPWTWEHFVMHARTTHPFVLTDGAAVTINTLRAEGAAFSLAFRQPVTSDYDGLWLINIMVRDLGAV